MTDDSLKVWRRVAQNYASGEFSEITGGHGAELRVLGRGMVEALDRLAKSEADRDALWAQLEAARVAIADAQRWSDTWKDHAFQVKAERVAATQHSERLEALLFRRECERASIQAERDQLKAQLEKVTKDMDRAGGDGYGMPECPWCRCQSSDPDYQHAGDCELVAAREALERLSHEPRSS